MPNIFWKLKLFFKRKPLPFAITNILLMIKFDCRISLDAKIYHPFNIKIGKNSRLYSATIYSSGGGVEIEKGCEIGNGVVLNAQGSNIKLGAGTRIGEYVIVYGEGGVVCKEDTLIAAHSCIVSSNHTYDQKNIPISKQPTFGKPITLEGDNWIGTGVKILSGTTIGKGTIVGAGSVVTKDIEAYKIAYGVPAKAMRDR